MPHKHRVVIVGGGFGGIRTALKLAKDDRLVVTLISDKDHFLYYPALYATATGHSHLQSIVPLSEIFAGQSRVRIIQDTVTGIDAHRKHVTGASGRHYDYDQVIFALGVVTSYFGIEGLAEHSFSIKSKDEVQRFKNHLHETLTSEHRLDRHYVVVGAGPTGVELSAALATYLDKIARAHHIRHSRIRLSLIEAAPRVLPRMSEKASAAVSKRLKRLGVEVRVNAKVERQDDDELVINGRPLLTHTVIWTSGVSNHPFFAEHGDLFELEKNGRVKVDAYLQATNDIFVIGDNASTPYTGLAQTALHDADFVATVIRSRLSGRKVPVYQAVKPPVVVPVGERWAIFEWGPARFGGQPGSWMRRAADAIGYHDVLPIGHALEAWRSEKVVEETCDVCFEANL